MAEYNRKYANKTKTRNNSHKGLVPVSTLLKDWPEIRKIYDWMTFHE